MNSKKRCIEAIKGNQVDRTPVFPLLMYLAAEKFRISYREFATNGSAMASSQINMFEHFDIDAITSCSDAFRITADLGADMCYPENQTPFSRSPLVSSEADLRALRRPDATASSSRMQDRVRGVREMVKAVGDECLVLGWVDMPFAEACSLCGVSNFMMLVMENPLLAHQVLDFLCGIVIDFSLLQLEAGAPMIGAGDAAASMVSLEIYREFVLPYEQRVISAINAKKGMVKLHICGNTTHLLEEMCKSGADLYNVDHLVPFSKANEVYSKHGLCYKGNLDPVAHILRADPEDCRTMAEECIGKAEGSRFILSAGCEIPAKTPDDVFSAFCKAPQTYQFNT